MSQASSRSMMVKWFFTIGAPAIVAFVPTNEFFSWQLKWYLVSTLFAILCWALEVLPLTPVSIALPLFWTFFGIAEPAVAFSPWSTYVPWMILSGLIMAMILKRTGLLERIAYHCILMTGASYNGILVGLAITSFFLTLLVGNVQVPLAALSYGICIALNTGKSKASCGIMMVTAMVSLTTLTMSFQGTVAIIVGIGAALNGDTSLLGFFQSIFVNLPIIGLMVILTLVSMKLFKPDKTIEGKEYFTQKLEDLGKLSRDELKCILVLIIYFAFMLTTRYTGLNLVWGLAFVPLLLCAPVIGVATAKDFDAVNFGFIIFIAACISIGAVGVSLGIGQILAQVILPLVAGKNYIAFFVISAIAIFGLNFLMTPLAIQSAFTVPLTTIGMSMGLNPMAIYYFIACVGDQIILPYEYALYLLPFSFGLIKMGDFIKIMSIKTVLAFATIFLILLPWWNMVGFLFQG